jgi:Sensors of blue-light using FAD
MLSCLTYVSKRSDLCSDQEIERILAVAANKNPHIDVTGVLLCSEQKFFQYIEGRYSDLIMLYDKIKLDARLY